MKTNHMKTTGRKNPALMELVLVILFFALSSMVLVQVFVKAKTISQTSQAKTLGLLAAEDILEQWRADPTQPESLFLPEHGWKEETAGAETGEGETAGVETGESKTAGVKTGEVGTAKAEEIRVFYAVCDEAMNLLSGEEAYKEGRYRLQAVLSKEKQPAGRLYRIEVTLTELSGGAVLVECETAQYLPGEMRDE